MKNRTYLVIIFSLFILGLFMGGLIDDTTNNVEVSDTDIDTAYYVEDKRNVFVVVAKGSENVCYYTVTFVFEGIKNIFSSIFGI